MLKMFMRKKKVTGKKEEEQKKKNETRGEISRDGDGGSSVEIKLMINTAKSSYNVGKLLIVTTPNRSSPQIRQEEKDKTTRKD